MTVQRLKKIIKLQTGVSIRVGTNEVGEKFAYLASRGRAKIVTFNVNPQTSWRLSLVSLSEQVLEYSKSVPCPAIK